MNAGGMEPYGRHYYRVRVQYSSPAARDGRVRPQQSITKTR